MNERIEEVTLTLKHEARLTALAHAMVSNQEKSAEDIVKRAETFLKFLLPE